MVALTTVGFAALPGLGAAFLIGKDRRVGMAILASLLISLILVAALQFLALRPRPENVRLLQAMPNFPAFPSGHAAAAFGTAVVLGLSLRRLRWWAVALTGAALIALSRVYLGHHYPSDILGGAALGASVGAVCYAVWVQRQPGQSVWRWLLWPQVAIVILISQMAYLNLIPAQVFIWPWTDKVMHFVLFGAVTFWLNLWVQGRKVSLWDRSVPLAVALPFLIATLEEGAQQLSPLRSSSWSDLSSDLLGMMVFWGLSQWLLSRQTDSLTELE
jgi:undecaprenyl-diphosphatase